MRFEFTRDEYGYIYNSDLCLTEVGLKLCTRDSEENGNFVLICSDDDGNEFLQAIADELAFRGFRPEDTMLRKLASRLGVAKF